MFYSGIFVITSHGNMAPVRNFSLTVSFKAITNKPFYLRHVRFGGLANNKYISMFKIMLLVQILFKIKFTFHLQLAILTKARTKCELYFSSYLSTMENNQHNHIASVR